MTFGRLLMRAIDGARTPEEEEEILDFCNLFDDLFHEDLDDIKVTTYPKEEANNVNR